jgi:hypothetical protein
VLMALALWMMRSTGGRKRTVSSRWITPSSISFHTGFKERHQLKGWVYMLVPSTTLWFRCTDLSQQTMERLVVIR